MTSVQAASRPAPEFSLLADLGVVKVPEYYEPRGWIKALRKKLGQKISTFPSELIAEDATSPSRVLRPKEELRVRVFEQAMPGPTTFEERMEFLRAQGAVYPGIYADLLVIAYLSERLPLQRTCVSLVEKERAWHGHVNCPHCNGRVFHYVVPGIEAFTPQSIAVRLGRLNGVWHEHHALLCYTEAG